MSAFYPLQTSASQLELNLHRCFLGIMSDKGELYDEATKVSAENGEVILDGPDGVDVRLTPEAAQETSDNILEGAAEAAGQRVLKELPHKPLSN